MGNAIQTVENSITERTPELIAAEIRALTGSVLGGILEIGRRFCEAKELLAHGKFSEWVRNETGYSMSTAGNFMRLFREYGADQGSLFGASAKSQTIGNLGYAKALALLEIPAEERESFAQEVDAEGLSVRELKEAIREREEKLTEARNTAEGYRLKLERERADKEALLTQKAEEVEAANTELERLRQELRELQDTPKEVAVETVVDEEAIEKAAQEARNAAEKELQAKIKKAEEERDKAIAERQKAQKAKTEAEEKLAAANLEKDNAEETARKAQEIAAGQLQELQKKLALADSPEKVSFKFWFDQGQACVNNMLDCAQRLRQNGKSEDADKLTGALKVFLETAIEKVSAGI